MPKPWRTADVPLGAIAAAGAQIHDRSVRSGPRIVLGLGVAGAVLLAVIGVSYTLSPHTLTVPPAPVGWWLATLAFIGGIALAATAVWQWQAGGVVRLFFVVVLAGLSAAWLAASTLGILTSASELPHIPIALHWIGLGMSTGLFFASLMEATRSLRELPGRETRETSRPPAPHRPE